MIKNMRNFLNKRKKKFEAKQLKRAAIRANKDRYMTSEQILAECKTPVLDLLAGYQAKRSYHEIINMTNQKPHGIWISNPKTKIKTFRPFKMLWPRNLGTLRR